MEFKKGDKILCIDAYDSPQHYLKQYKIYTFAKNTAHLNGFIELIETNKYSFLKKRFIPMPTTLLERIIYGISEDLEKGLKSL